MSSEKPVHVPRAKYPEAMYPQVVTASSGEYDEQQGHLLGYWRVIVARRWLIIATFLTIVTATAIYTFKETPIYKATASIQIDRENPNILSFKDVYQIETSTDDTLRTQHEVLKSRSLVRRVIEEMKLDQKEEFARQSTGVTDSLMSSIRSFFSPKVSDEADRLRPIIDRYLDHLEVAPVRLARLVKVSFESKDPVLAAQVINAHVRLFIERNLQFKVEATQEASNFLDDNLGTLKGKLEKSEDRLQEYSRQNEILFTEEGKNTATEKLRQLEEEYTKAVGDRIQKESYNRLVQIGNSDSLPQLIGNNLIGDLTGKLADLQRQEAEMSVTFRPDYPARQRLRGQIIQIGSSIQSEKVRVVTMIQSEYAASVERERLLAGELEKQRGLVEKINQQIIQYNILKREGDSIKELYDGLLKRQKEAVVSAGLTASNIHPVDRAEVPPRPVRPRKTLNLFLGMVSGLLCGLGFAFFQEYLDSTLKAPEDVSRYLNVPILGIVPKLQSTLGKKGYSYGAYTKAYLPAARPKEISAEKIDNVDLIVHEAPSSLMAEAYRSVRTSLLLSSPGRPPRTIVVTSASPSEGKTVTAVNLAISLTQTGAKVALIDADMRKPRVDAVFGLGNSIGLSAFLTGGALLKEILHQTSIPGLFVIPCGVRPPNPGELVLSSGFKQMIEVVAQFFDYVVMDTPPVCTVSDARVLGAVADSTILVVKAFSTSRHQGRDAATHLINAHARIAGVVLNDLDVRRPSYYSGYSYSGSYNPYGQYGGYGTSVHASKTAHASKSAHAGKS